MKIKKALIPLAITVLLALAATPALAAEIHEGATPPGYTNTGDAKVEASVNTTYTITIPDRDVLKFEHLTAASPEADRTKTFAVSAAGIVLEPDKQLKVSVSGQNNAFRMTHTGLPTLGLPYTITPEGGQDLAPGGTLAVFQNQETRTVNSTLVVAAPTMGAGNYFDTLTFTCTVEAKGVTP